jgi:hypothetical protein
LGTVANKLTFLNGDVSQTFTNGGSCAGGGKISTTVLYVCDPTGKLYC